MEATVATRTKGVSMSTWITVASAISDFQMDVVSKEKVCEIIDDCGLTCL